MLKNVLKILVVFIVGGVGGIFAEQIWWPYFVERPLFYKYRLEQNPVYITEKKQVVIRENTALEEAVEKVEKTAVGVMSRTKAGKTLKGGGLVVTSDGLVVSLAELLPRGADFYFFLAGKAPAYQVLKRDAKTNLALVKVEASGLSAAGFADFKKIKRGERVFLIGPKLGRKAGAAVVNEGVVKSVGENLIETNMTEKAEFQGGPIFNIEGDAVGLALIGPSGQVSAIPISKIKKFIGF